MKRITRSVTGMTAALVTVMVGAGLTATASSAAAASLVQVTDFGANPSNLEMYVYVPDTVVANAPIVVVNHYCTGSASAMYNGTQFDELASTYGYIVIYPSATRSGSCFDVSSSATLTHNGGSDSLGIVSMVKYVQSHYDTDESRVFATGSSSGAMMTNVLLAVYPDVFAAGSVFAGVPATCFSTTGDSLWNSACATGTIAKSAQEWGDVARAAYPGYTGEYPRIQLWHGTNDETLNYANFSEEIKQWTNLHGLSQTPTSTDVPATNQARTRYGSSGGQAPVEAISLIGATHNLPVDAAEALRFFGIAASASASAPATALAPTLTATAMNVPTVASSGGCSALLTVIPWSTGYLGFVTVKAGSSAITSWNATVNLQSSPSVTAARQGLYSLSGSTTTVSNVRTNGALAAGASTVIGSIGFVAKGSAPSGTVTTSCTAG